jgi:two-component system nitrate/nitrite response regulator NarL
LALAVREVAEGRTYFSHNALMELRRLSSDATTARELLTPKETEVLRLVALGHLNKEIADQLGVSIRTVETHRFNLRKKLDLADTASLTRYAIQCGLVKA